MLDKAQLTDLFETLGTPVKGRELVTQARACAPVREVKSSGNNVITVFQSRKTGMRVRTESRHIEFAAAVEKEYDDTVLEYYPQPCHLRLELVDERTGEIHKINHYPDFLVITEQGITVEEWKPQHKLEKLSRRYPYRYQCIAGQWRAPQIEEQLSQLGIRYRVRTDRDIGRRRVENLRHLADYLDEAAEPCPEVVIEKVQAALDQHGMLYLSELQNKPYGFEADHLLKAVADGRLLADLERETLAQPRQARLFRDAVFRDFIAAQKMPEPRFSFAERYSLPICEGAVFKYDGRLLTITLVGDQKVICAYENGTDHELDKNWLIRAHESGQIETLKAPHSAERGMAQHSHEALREALRRKGELESDSRVPERTRRRWQSRRNAAQLAGHDELLALVPRSPARGNRQPRLSEMQERLINEIAVAGWRQGSAPTYKSCYQQLRKACAEHGIEVPSYPTTIKRIKQAVGKHDLRARMGRRAAYQASDFVDVLYCDTPVHGSRPLESVHIDHTQLDLELISARTGQPLGRPWISFAIDAWSRRIVGFYLTYDPPSYISVMMTMRDMVQRHGRLPEQIVVDNGADFRSTAFETLLCASNVSLRFRPAGQPRHGAVIERVFGSLHSQYIHNLAGNTKAMKDVRNVSGKHLPVNQAQWTLETAYLGIQHWAFEFYDNEVHPAWSDSPRAVFQRGLNESGARSHRRILYNRDFLIATCPPVDREGLRKIDSQRGVKVNERYYWSPELRNARYLKERWPVRYDPWDASSVYVWLHDHWVQARCRALLGLGQMTEAERQLLTDEIDRKRKTNQRETDARANQRLREFLDTHTPEGALAKKLERQNENKHLYDALNMASVDPVEPAHSHHKEKFESAPAEDMRPQPDPSRRGDETNPDAFIDFDTF